MTEPEIEAVLKVMADDAFEVLNWARRQGMKREQQTAQVVAAYRKTLADTKTSMCIPYFTTQTQGCNKMSDRPTLQELGITPAIALALANAGFVVVPKEPTPEMLEEGWADAHDEDAAGTWRAMVQAALSSGSC